MAAIFKGMHTAAHVLAKRNPNITDFDGFRASEDAAFLAEIIQDLDVINLAKYAVMARAGTLGDGKRTKKGKPVVVANTPEMTVSEPVTAPSTLIKAADMPKKTGKKS